MNNPIALCVDRNPFESIEKLIPLVAGVGFAGIEWHEGGMEERWTNSETAATIRDLSRKSELACQYHAPYAESFDLGQEEGALRAPDSVAGVIAHMLDRADRLGARLVTTHVGSCPPEANRSEALQTIVEGIRIVSPELEKRGIRLALENLTPGSSDMPLGTLAEDFDVLMASIPSEWVGQTIDVAHAYLCGNLLDFLARPLDRLFNVHLHDNHGESDEHLPVGKGNIPLDEVLGRLSEVGYRGPMTFEFLTEADVYLDAIGRVRCCN